MSFFDVLGKVLSVTPAYQIGKKLLGGDDDKPKPKKEKVANRYTTNPIEELQPMAGVPKDMKATGVKEIFDLESKRTSKNGFPGFHEMQCIQYPFESRNCGQLEVANVQPVPNDFINAGLLSKIIIHHDATMGIQGIEQFFGQGMSYYQGTHGSFKETTFEIPLNDPLISILAHYEKPGWSRLDSIRLRTLSGKDSGWIGHTAPDSTVYVHELHLNSSPSDPAEKMVFPIYAVDIWKPAPITTANDIHMLSVRYTRPFVVSVKQVEPADPNDNASEIEISDVRKLVYSNASSIYQTIEFQEEVTNTISHSVTNSTTDSATSSMSLSVGAAIMYEGASMSMNETESHSKTHSVTHSDTVKMSRKISNYVVFPVAIEKRTKAVVTLKSSTVKTTRKATLGISYIGRNSIDLNVEFSASDEISYHVDIEEHPLDGYTA